MKNKVAVEIARRAEWAAGQYHNVNDWRTEDACSTGFEGTLWDWVFNDTRALEASQAGVGEDDVERAAKAYADAVGYYVPFHRGLSSQSANQIRKGIRAALAALTTTTCIEASQAQGVNQAYAVAVTMTKNMPNGLNIMTRLNTRSASSMDEAVGMAVADAQEANPEHGIFSIAKIALTPPQAAESGLLEGMQEYAETFGFGEKVWPREFVVNAIEYARAKAGKQGEGDREG